MNHIKKIYLVRHGETELNKKGVLQGGDVNYSLNKKGERQAECFFNKLAEVPFKKVYTSTLKRSIESVRLFVEKGIPQEIEPGLNEIGFGEMDGIAPSRGQNTMYDQLVTRWNLGETNTRLPGGETPEEVRARLIPFINKILKTPEDDLILISMHGRALRIFLTTILGLPLTEMKNFPHSNFCLYVLEYDGEKVIPIVENDSTHLDCLVEKSGEEEIRNNAQTSIG